MYESFVSNVFHVELKSKEFFILKVTVFWFFYKVIFIPSEINFSHRVRFDNNRRQLGMQAEVIKISRG